MPHFIPKIVEKESKRWQDLIGNAHKLQEKVSINVKQFGDLCVFLENDVNGKLATGSFAAGCKALEHLLDTLNNIYNSGE